MNPGAKPSRGEAEEAAARAHVQEASTHQAFHPEHLDQRALRGGDPLRVQDLEEASPVPAERKSSTEVWLGAGAHVAAESPILLGQPLQGQVRHRPTRLMYSASSDAIPRVAPKRS